MRKRISKIQIKERLEEIQSEYGARLIFTSDKGTFYLTNGVASVPFSTLREVEAFLNGFINGLRF